MIPTAAVLVLSLKLFFPAPKQTPSREAPYGTPIRQLTVLTSLFNNWLNIYITSFRGEDYG